MSEDDNPHLWILGVALSIIGSVMSTGGVNMQKYTFKRAESLGGQSVSYWRQPLWALGLAMVVLGSIGDFMALGFAAQSIVAPVGSSTLVANIVFAKIWLKEALSSKDLAGTTLILTGSIVAVVFGNHTEATYTLEEIVALYQGTLFIVYIVFCIAAIVVLSVVTFRCQTLLQTINSKQVEIGEIDMRRHPDIVARMHTQMIALDSAYAPYVKWHPFSICTLSGTLGAQSIMFAKCMAVLLRRTFEGDNQFGKPLTYVFLLACASTISGQIHFLAIALQRFDALYVVPVFQCAFIGVSTLGGVCFFKEFASFNAVQSVMFPFGLAMTLGGVYLLSQRKMASSVRRQSVELANRPGFSHRSWAETQKSIEEFNDDMDQMAPLVPLLGAAWRIRQSMTQDELLNIASMQAGNWAELSSDAESRRDRTQKDDIAGELENGY